VLEYIVEHRLYGAEERASAAAGTPASDGGDRDG